MVAILSALGVVGNIGCGREQVAPKSVVSDVAKVSVAKPEPRSIVREVGQPSFIEAFEQTAIYAKLPGYVEKWEVDIGDPVKKGQTLATLFVPELLKELEEKKALVLEAEAMVEQAKKLVAVADANVRAADFQVQEASAKVGQSKAMITRWQSEVARLRGMVKDNVVDKQVLAESERQLQSSEASDVAALAAVNTAKANLLGAQASLDKSKVDVIVASAKLDVARAQRDRVQALTGYLKLQAPYDGIVILRNANTGDFVLPATGDPSAPRQSRDESANKATPVFVVARTDVVRVYVDVSESDAGNIVSRVQKQSGDSRAVTQGRVRVYALENKEIPAEATRTTWALNFKSRTLRTEIDLPNVGAKLLPGMYAYGTLTIERQNVMAVPLAAVTEVGNQFGCFLNVGGKAVWTPVRTGVNDGVWIELEQKLVGGKWIRFDGSEQVVIDNLRDLSDGSPIEVITKSS